MFGKSEELYSTLTLDNQAVINYIKDTLKGTIPASYNKTEGRIVIISNPENKENQDDNANSQDNSTDDNILLLAIIISISVVLFIIIILIIYIKVNRKRHENDMKNEIANLNSKLEVDKE